MSMVVYKMFHHLLLDLEFYAFALKNKAIKAEVLGDKKYSYSFLIFKRLLLANLAVFIFSRIYTFLSIIRSIMKSKSSLTLKTSWKKVFSCVSMALLKSL